MTKIFDFDTKAFFKSCEISFKNKTCSFKFNSKTNQKLNKILIDKSKSNQKIAILIDGKELMLDGSLKGQEDSLREEKNLTLLNDLFKAKGPRRLFFFYQVREAQNEQGEWVPISDEMSLYATDGRTEPLRGRAVWFLRKAREN